MAAKAPTIGAALRRHHYAHLQFPEFAGYAFRMTKRRLANVGSLAIAFAASLLAATLALDAGLVKFTDPELDLAAGTALLILAGCGAALFLLSRADAQAELRGRPRGRSARVATRLALLLTLLASLYIAGRYAPKALFLTLIVFAMNDTGVAFSGVLLRQMQFLLPLWMLAGGMAAAFLALRRPTNGRALVACLAPGAALLDAVYFSQAW